MFLCLRTTGTFVVRRFRPERGRGCDWSHPPSFCVEPIVSVSIAPWRQAGISVGALNHVLAPDTLRKVSELPNVRGVKDSGFEMIYFHKLVWLFPRSANFAGVDIVGN
jgi:hypothetical protein